MAEPYLTVGPVQAPDQDSTMLPIPCTCLETSRSHSPGTPSCGGHLDSQGPTARPALKTQAFGNLLGPDRTFYTGSFHKPPCKLGPLSIPLQSLEFLYLPNIFFFREICTGWYPVYVPGQHSNHCGSAHHMTNSRKAEPRKPSCSAAHFSESKAQASLLLTADYWPKDKETRTAL